MMNLLYVKWNASPYIFRIGDGGLRWYGVLFVGGFIFGYWLMSKFFKRENVSEKLLDPLLWTSLLAALIGARLGHIIFYEPDYYLANPSEIIKVWHGGLASHGGAIAMVIGILWYAKKYGKKNNFDALWLFDRFAIAIPFAGMAIRLGNLMNSEIYGYETNLPWGFIFVQNGEVVPKHPTQLYEAGAYLVIGLLLLSLYYLFTKNIGEKSSNESKQQSPIYRGFLIGLFLVLLFGARFIIEYVKEPQVEAEVGKLFNNGQLLSLPFIVAGIAVIVYSYIKKKPLARV